MGASVKRKPDLRVQAYRLEEAAQAWRCSPHNVLQLAIEHRLRLAVFDRIDGETFPIMPDGETYDYLFCDARERTEGFIYLLPFDVAMIDKEGQALVRTFDLRNSAKAQSDKRSLQELLQRDWRELQLELELDDDDGRPTDDDGLVTYKEPRLVRREHLRVTLEEWEQFEAEALSQVASRQDATLGERAETTYLNIIGGLLGLLLGKSPSGNPYSSFKTQAAVIAALLGNYPAKAGLSERTLQQKFAEAKSRLDSA